MDNGPPIVIHAAREPPRARHHPGGQDV